MFVWVAAHLSGGVAKLTSERWFEFDSQGETPDEEHAGRDSDMSGSSGHC